MLNGKEIQMAKRFTDNNKWEDDWFASLPPKHKLFWFYICDRCDHAGVWKISAHVASALIGEPIDLDEAAKAFEGRIEIHEGFWWIKKFCDFQYGRLNPENKTHKSVLKIIDFQGLVLDYNGISENPRESTSSHRGAKDTDMVKDKAKDEFELWYSEYPRKQKKEDAFKAWCDLNPNAELQAIMKSVIPAQIKGNEWWKDDKKQFIPLPASWIRAKRWTDQFQQVREDAPKKFLRFGQ